MWIWHSFDITLSGRRVVLEIGSKCGFDAAWIKNRRLLLKYEKLLIVENKRFYENKNGYTVLFKYLCKHSVLSMFM